jgi:hypothetical protein
MMLIIMWTTTLGLGWIISNNNNIIVAQSLYGDLELAKALIDANWLLMAAMVILGLTSTFATIRKFLA